ncbi:P-loop NTPase [Candidatus Portiera aleyrodidarum]|uniref:Iron-sulfur cluster carrier protein n=1 Tax=Candidatus Portiera aleyrodidarum TaxID=91844 RepID=A0A8D9JSY1_9GAMM|nr:P-loop NTPase [Candidatus Portiera aleyrodidarum]CEI58814.1 ATPase involved in chromosome partitioning [Candidatus Portiera aleyrodidarum]
MFNIKYIIALSSVKGGVGKSTLTTNLALAMNIKGYKVGLLDADISGSSQAKILGIKKNIFINNNLLIQPIPYYGLKVMSMGFIVKKQTKAIIWRGPIISKFLLNLFKNTNWGTLDYLFIDMPPGTADLSLTLLNNIKLSGVIIITTPQEISLLGAFKAINMFKKIKIPIIGLIENMSSFTCTFCGYSKSIFYNKYIKILKKYKIKKLGCLPLHKYICDKSPILISKPNSKISKLFNYITTILERTVAQLVRAPR